jgi:hypothetical protein
MTMTKDFIFVHKSITDRSVFDPIDPLVETLVEVDDTVDMAFIAVTMGLFSSKTQARKNGWLGIPKPGYTLRRVSDGKRILEILMPLSEETEKQLAVADKEEELKQENGDPTWEQ